MKKVFILALFLLVATSSLAEMLSVTHQPAELRNKSMVAGSKVIKKLDRFAPLQIVEKGTDYHKVKTADGVTGYIHKSLTGKIKTVIVTAGVCNVRTGPGTEFPIAFKAKKGNNFKVLSQEQDWIEIKTSKGKTGWIWQNLVWGE